MQGQCQRVARHLWVCSTVRFPANGCYRQSWTWECKKWKPD